MIVTCERCETQFQLDDARVPADGVRVRCSRCKHAFQVMRSEGRSLVAAQAAPASRGLEADDEESDWQFNADLPSDAAEASGSAALRDAAMPREEPDEDPAAQFGWDDDPSSDAAAAPDPLGSPDDPDGLEDPELSRSGLDLLEDLDRSAPSRPTPPALREARPASAFPVAEVAVGVAQPSVPLPRPASEVAAEADAADDGASASAEDWSFLADEDDEPASRGKRRLPPAAPGARAGDVEASSPVWQRWAGVASRYAGGVFVTVVFLYGLAGAWPAAAPLDAPLRQGLGGGLEVAGASGRWVENAVHGPLYVVSGSLWNAGERSALPPSLGIEWLDREGRVLERAPMAATAPRRHERLREAALDELANGRPLPAGGPLPPGAGVPFELVVASLPEAAAQFQVVPLAPAQPRTPTAPRVARDAATRRLDTLATRADTQPGADERAAPPAAPAE